jgi:hypothetical protein
LNPRNGVHYLLLWENGPRTQLYGVEMEMESILLIVGRVENNLSVGDSRFGHRTLMAIILGSQQMVSYTCIQTWGIP